MAVVYVRPTNGSDANTYVQSQTFATAKKTLASAYADSTEGDEIRLCNEAAEAVTANLSWTKTMTLVGADTTDGSPLAGAGVYELSFSGMAGGVDAFTLGTTGKTMKMVDVYLNGGTGGQYGLASGFDAYTVWMKRCRVSNFGSHGFYWITTAGNVSLFDCEVDNNGGSGISVNAGGRGNFAINGGSYHDNTSKGIHIGGDYGEASVDSALVYGNGDDGIHVEGTFTPVRNCTVYGNTNGTACAGINFGAADCSAFNNTCVSNTTYGIEGVSNLNAYAADFNHTHGNGSVSDGTLPGENNVTGDPKFTSTTGGSEDFTPLTTSPLIGAGVNGSNIGAVAHADGGGSGGLITHPGMTGGTNG